MNTQKLLHTAEHILGQVLDELCEGFQTTSLQMREDSVRYDFKVISMPEKVTGRLLEEKVNGLINKQVDVSEETVKRSEAIEKGYDVSMVPETIQDIRLVNISGINIQPCAGEHVQNTKEIEEYGTFKIKSFKKKGANAYQIIATIAPQNEKSSSLQTASNAAKEMLEQNQNTKRKKLGTQPYKGARDFYPQDLRLRNYIFETFSSVCKKYGYEEYDFPFLEPFELYAAKSGEELVNNQLYSFEDRGGRKVAIRPEKTPTLARMVAARINELPKPVRWFNIGQCWRYEKPQKGRGREFYQMDCDILGEPSIAADAEVYSIPVEVMLKLGATEKMFEIRVADRKLAEFYLGEVMKLSGRINEKETQMNKVAKAVDGMHKMDEKGFIALLEKQGLSAVQVDQLQKFVCSDLSFLEQYREESPGAREILEFFELIDKRGLLRFFRFRPDIMRQFDYSTGIVIEQFDLDPTNNRSMYGGERYDDLVSLFSDQPLTGTGFAMGDVTLIEFLKGWNLIPQFESETKVYVSVFSEGTKETSFQITQKLREAGINTLSALDTSQKLDKQLKNADRRGIPFVIVIGPDEVKKGTVILKDMKAKKQEELEGDALIKKLL